jgi:hypothetical protein
MCYIERGDYFHGGTILHEGFELFLPSLFPVLQA